MWTEIAEERERIRDDLDSLNGDCETLNALKADLEKRERKLERDQEKLKRLREQLEGEKEEIDLMKSSLDKERAEMVKTLSIGARINYDKLAKRVNTIHEEETRIKYGQQSSSILARTNMTAFLTKCSCKTGLNESGIYNCDVHKQRNASLSQLSINMGMACSL
jgi:peptidoglycan hydrolase CwlO-like protein